jgi:hypothetical protein
VIFALDDDLQTPIATSREVSSSTKLGGNHKII